jgi:uncharacterized protein (TIGR03118 family)
MRNLFPKTFLVTWIAVGALWAGTLHAQVADFVQVNLVSDIPGLATITEPKLVNPWGVSHSTTSPFWTSNQGTQTATLFAVTDRTKVSKVNINPPAGFVAIPPMGTGGPTGQVSNVNTSSFPVNNGGDGGSAHFIFANLNGTISAWDTGTTAFIQVTTPGATYTGLAINGAQTQLYAANGAGSGSVDVFDSSFTPVSLGDSAFVNPALPAGLVPFNVRDIGGNIYVTYAPAGRPAQISAPLGAGAVAIFDEDGNFITQLITGGRLAAPWGMTLAPAGFGRFINHYWSVTSAFSIAGSTPSTRQPGSSVGRSRSMSARATRRAGFGPLISGSAAVTAIPIPSTSLTGSTARRTGCSAPYSRTGTARRTSRTALFAEGSRGTACIGGGAAEPATCSPRRPQARLLTSNSYGRPLVSR